MYISSYTVWHGCFSVCRNKQNVYVFTECLNQTALTPHMRKRRICNILIFLKCNCKTWNLNKKDLRLSRRQCLVVASSRISILTAARTTERPQVLLPPRAPSADRLWTPQTDSSTLISWLRGREMFSYASGFCYPSLHPPPPQSLFYLPHSH